MNDIYKPSDDTELLLDVVSKYTNTTILEIGIGSGLILQTLASNNNNVVGIDINSNGQRLFVSGRGDGNLHVLNSNNGVRIKSIPLNENASAAMATGLIVLP